MIAQLTGVVAEKTPVQIIIDVNGVGYGVFVTSEDQGQLAQGDRAKLHIYEHIREQSHDLFGFVGIDTKKLFEQLLGVNGVGPKMALNILSVGNSSQVCAAIANGDVKRIQQANGVGKRVAERVVVDLKDKVGLQGVELGDAGLLTAANSMPRDEAAEGLISLGYSLEDAARALSDVPADLPAEDRIKQALKGSR